MPLSLVLPAGWPDRDHFVLPSRPLTVVRRPPPAGRTISRSPCSTRRVTFGLLSTSDSSTSGDDCCGETRTDSPLVSGTCNGADVRRFLRRTDTVAPDLGGWV